MRQSRFSEEQIIAILREHEAGAKTADVCRRHGVSDALGETQWSFKYCQHPRRVFLQSGGSLGLFSALKPCACAACGRGHQHAREESLIGQLGVAEQNLADARLHLQMHADPPTGQEERAIAAPNALDWSPVPNF